MEGSKNDVQPGNYTIQVTDNSGCTKELEITISGPYVYTVEDAVVTQLQKAIQMALLILH
jgi:hypothetical protein